MLFRWIKYLCKYLGLEIQYFYILDNVGITYCYLPFGCRSWKIKLIKEHYTTIKKSIPMFPKVRFTRHDLLYTIVRLTYVIYFTRV